MTSTVQHSDTRQAKPATERRALEGGFKRLALPAVAAAAAVQTLARSRASNPASQDGRDPLRRAGQSS